MKTPLQAIWVLGLALISAPVVGETAPVCQLKSSFVDVPRWIGAAKMTEVSTRSISLPWVNCTQEIPQVLANLDRETKSGGGTHDFAVVGASVETTLAKWQVRSQAFNATTRLRDLETYWRIRAADVRSRDRLCKFRIEADLPLDEFYLRALVTLGNSASADNARAKVYEAPAEQITNHSDCERAAVGASLKYLLGGSKLQNNRFEILYIDKAAGWMSGETVSFKNDSPTALQQHFNDVFRLSLPPL